MDYLAINVNALKAELRKRGAKIGGIKEQLIQRFAALMRLYSVSYMWYAVIGTVVCVAVGVGVGLLTASDEDAFDERLLHPLVARLARRMPGKKRKFTGRADDAPEEKECSEKTDETAVEDPSPQRPALASLGSRAAGEPPCSSTRL